MARTLTHVVPTRRSGCTNEIDEFYNFPQGVLLSSLPRQAAEDLAAVVRLRPAVHQSLVPH